jgi:hypothetical protein
VEENLGDVLCQKAILVLLLGIFLVKVLLAVPQLVSMVPSCVEVIHAKVPWQEAILVILLGFFLVEVPLAVP